LHQGETSKRRKRIRVTREISGNPIRSRKGLAKCANAIISAGVTRAINEKEKRKKETNQKKKKKGEEDEKKKQQSARHFR